MRTELDRFRRGENDLKSRTRLDQLKCRYRIIFVRLIVIVVVLFVVLVLAGSQNKLKLITLILYSLHHAFVPSQGCLFGGILNCAMF